MKMPPSIQENPRLAEVEARLAEAEETLRAIRGGEVDALVIVRPEGDRVFTVEGAETLYRFLIEEMNEGALLLGLEGMILYANARFAQLAGRPLDQVIGCSWGRFFAAAPGTQQALLAAARTGGVRDELHLRSPAGALRPVGVSLRSLKQERMEGISVVVTDLTEQKHAQELLQSEAKHLERLVQERTAQLEQTNRQLCHENDERRRLERGMLTAVEGERQRLGRELHDGLSQLLTAAKFKISLLEHKLARKRLVDPAEARALERDINQAIEQARAMAHGLNPVTLVAEGLVSALTELAGSVRSAFQLRCVCECPKPVAIADHHIAHHLYRIAQEAVHNAIKHGRPRNLKIELKELEGRITLAVLDDGVGFPPGPANPTGIGLQNMKARANLIGGALEIRPRPGGGTAVICTLGPLPVEQNHV